MGAHTPTHSHAIAKETAMAYSEVLSRHSPTKENYEKLNATAEIKTGYFRYKYITRP
jgi:hypothetical protein